MNNINPKKLLNSKWTAVKPANKEKHFLIVELEFSEKRELERCVLEAVVSKRSETIEWTKLKDSRIWHQGWK